MRVLFDISRYYRRAARSTRTGIDRADHAYAHFLPGLCEEVNFVAGGRTPRLLAAEKANSILASGTEDPPIDPVYVELQDFLARPTWVVDGACRRFSNRSAQEASWISRSFANFRLSTQTQALPRNLEGTIYVNTSHKGLENRHRIGTLKSRGARIVVLLHDLIPLDFPEFCRSGEDRKHQARLECISQYADLVIANSEYSRSRFLAWAGAQAIVPPKTVVVPLGVDDAFLAPPSWAPPLSPTPYFVCLGTIEARKNHAFLLLMWRRMAEELGSLCPRLVVVGRRGWKVELALDLLKGARPLPRSVIEVADLGDAGTVSLISGAHGVLQPSFVEGFSLPLIEARALGIPVIASNIPAHREIADDSTSLLDCLDAPSWERAILTLAATRTTRPPDKLPLNWRQHVVLAVDEIRKNLDLPMAR